MKKWYKVNGLVAHTGSGKSNEEIIYIYTTDICGVFDIYKTLPGIKKDTKHIDQIREMTPTENIQLEERIRQDPNISLKVVKKDGYYYSSKPI